VHNQGPPDLDYALYIMFVFLLTCQMLRMHFHMLPAFPPVYLMLHMLFHMLPAFLPVCQMLHTLFHMLNLPVCPRSIPQCLIMPLWLPPLNKIFGASALLHSKNNKII
jgi:hypothetical protein